MLTNLFFNLLTALGCVILIGLFLIVLAFIVVGVWAVISSMLSASSEEMEKDDGKR